jgi:hypothetical protein
VHSPARYGSATGDQGEKNRNREFRKNREIFLPDLPELPVPPVFRG